MAVLKKYRNKGWVYCARVGDFVKVGFTKSVRKRMGQLRSTTKLEVTLLGVMPGSFGLEQDFHDMLSPSRSHGKEWYYYTEQTKWAIEFFFQNQERTQIGNQPGNNMYVH